MSRYAVGYTCGVFELFHTGHLNLLERCKEQCDRLIVGVCDDDYIRVHKHREPVIYAADRVRIIASLAAVDQAVLIDAETTVDKMLAYSKFRFNVLFSGDDWKGSERYCQTEALFRGIGVDIVYFPYTREISTTALIRKIEQIFPD